VSGTVAGSDVREALTSADTAVMCRAKNSGTVAVGINASGSSVIGALDGVTLSSWNPVRAPRVSATTKVGHAERVEPPGGAAAGAQCEPARDQQRGDTGGDITQACGQGEQRRQAAEGHVEQEGHPATRGEDGIPASGYERSCYCSLKSSRAIQEPGHDRRRILRRQSQRAQNLLILASASYRADREAAVARRG